MTESPNPAAAGVRVEKDALGEVSVPADRLWGAQTQRSIENFPIGRSRYRWGRDVIRAFGIVKQCAARANAELGELPRDKAELIERAAQDVIDGRLDDEFPLVVWQTGSGTQSNMNANEVIANRAIQLAGGALGSKRPINPNDDVNRCQSSNDVFPAVMHVAAVAAIDTMLLPAVQALAATLETKAGRYAGLVMLGRTHLQDATPVTLGQVIGGWAAQLRDALATVGAALPGLHALALGGTAVGTGLNAGDEYRTRQPGRVGVSPVARRQADADDCASLESVALSDEVIPTLCGVLARKKMIAEGVERGEGTRFFAQRGLADPLEPRAR